MDKASIMKSALLYDYLRVLGGAETVSLTLAREFHSELWVGWRNHKIFPGSERQDILIHELVHRQWLKFGMELEVMHAFRYRLHLRGYKWVIFSGSFAPFAVHNCDSENRFLYCHTIPRFSFDMRGWYLSKTVWWKRPVLAMFMDYVKQLYTSAILEMKCIIANSLNVKLRLKKYLNRESIVVYPPCDTKAFQWLGESGYYLSTARIERYKRVDLIVEAFRKMPDLKLIVTSSGRDIDYLKKRAKGADNIYFTGWVTANVMRELVGNAIATIYLAKDEDFGMSAVESMAAGKPVIGVASGGLLEIVLDKVTGILVRAQPSVDEVIAAVREMTAARALRMRRDCEYYARQFSRERFLNQMKRIVFDGVRS